MALPLTTRLIADQTPLAILSEGCFGQHESKTAIGVIRYGRWPVIAVIDSTQAGRPVSDIIGGTSDAPVVASLADCFNQPTRPQALLIGTAPIGGGLPDTYRAIVKQAIEAGLHIISGLHIFLNHQPDLVALAEKHQVVLWDVRETTDENIVTRQLPRPPGTHVITMVGSDCSVGKMTVALEIEKSLAALGEKNTQFVATGQTGIMISGHGVPLDRVIGDFMAGTLEAEIDRVIKAASPRWVLVEGQGSLLHPAYSGVTMSLLHGSAPDAMVLVHHPARTTINQYPGVPLPDLNTLKTIYETAAGWIKPAPVLGIALNTSHLSDADAKALIAETAADTGLPTTDAVRFGAEPLASALMTHFGA